MNSLNPNDPPPGDCTLQGPPCTWTSTFSQSQCTWASSRSQSYCWGHYNNHLALVFLLHYPTCYALPKHVLVSPYLIFQLQEWSWEGIASDFCGCALVYEVLELARYLLESWAQQANAHLFDRKDLWTTARWCHNLWRWGRGQMPGS